jgi:threonyl-tRNA synthetase
VDRCLDFGYAIYDTFGFSPRLELSTRPAKRIGSEDMWDRAEAALEKALAVRGAEYELNPGDGAFYGPKIDLHMTDSIGRSWQLGTVQLDYVMPERFDLTYTGADNADHRPVMIHRALMGAFERFMGILIEHYAGEFPLWLAPWQAVVLPVADRHNDYARAVSAQLQASGLRARVDDRSESIGRKIREAELAKTPYMLVVGDREAAAGAASLRRHREGDLGTSEVGEIAARLAAEAAERRSGAA